MQQEELTNLCKELLNSQELVEKVSFDMINQHDKVANLISGLAMELDHMMCKLEAMSYMIEETVETLRQKQLLEEESNVRNFSDSLEEQGVHLIQVSQLLQTILEEQATECEVIHDLELKIEKQREIIEDALYIEN